LFFPTETPTPDFALLFPTETPAGLDIIAQLPTEDINLLPPAQDIDPVFLTATAIIANATATEAFNLTQTAMPFFVTATPTPDPFIFPTATSEIAPPVIGGQCVHYVLRGENLFRLSLRYGVPLTQIQAANPRITNINVVLVCQPITIPNCGTTGAVPPAPPAECLNTSLTPLPGQPLPPTTSTCGPTYRVEQGDTLFKISLRCNVPVMSIARANGIADINIIYINQELIIPSG
jgi:LysM repeat protein